VTPRTADFRDIETRLQRLVAGLPAEANAAGAGERRA